jgi:hypothetical protein
VPRLHAAQNEEAESALPSAHASRRTANASAPRIWPAQRTGRVVSGRRCARRVKHDIFHAISFLDFQAGPGAAASVTAGAA